MGLSLNDFDIYTTSLINLIIDAFQTRNKMFQFQVYLFVKEERISDEEQDDFFDDDDQKSAKEQKTAISAKREFPSSSTGVEVSKSVSSSKKLKTSRSFVELKVKLRPTSLPR